jgi:hypothetical protein
MTLVYAHFKPNNSICWILEEINKQTTALIHPDRQWCAQPIHTVWNNPVLVFLPIYTVWNNPELVSCDPEDEVLQYITLMACLANWEWIDYSLY